MNTEQSRSSYNSWSLHAGSLARVLFFQHKYFTEAVHVKYLAQGNNTNTAAGKKTLTFSCKPALLILLLQGINTSVTCSE